MNLQLVGGPFDGQTLEIPGWPEAVALTSGGKTHWHVYLGPPAESGESHDGRLYHTGDDSSSRTCLTDPWFGDRAEEWLEVNRRGRELTVERLARSLKSYEGAP